MDLIIACADIGSVAGGKFAWADNAKADGCLPSTLAVHVAELLLSGKGVALGFECPLFVPLPDKERLLGKGREGDGNRAWSAGAGCAVLTTGLVQVTWVLRAIRDHVDDSCPAFLRWGDFAEAGSGLFLWEAFVSGESKGADHVSDARIAVNAFDERLHALEQPNAIRCETEVYSLVGAALLRSGWSSDPGLLSEPCLIVRA